jgi:Spy/CpxP family protein refolding chaperone
VSAWKPILAALVIFAAGVVTGGLTVGLRRQTVGPRWATSSPDLPRPVVVGDGIKRPPEGSRWATSSPDLPRPWLTQRLAAQQGDLFRRMENHLDLRPEQRQRLEAIVRESQERIRALADDLAPRTREELRRMREKIREELTPEQRRKFEKIDAGLRRGEGGPKRGERPPP